MRRDLLSEIFFEGSRAAQLGMWEDDNPYVGKETRAAWQRGFDTERDAASFPFQALSYLAIALTMMAILYLDK